jgi:hypothetical protein
VNYASYEAVFTQCAEDREGHVVYDIVLKLCTNFFQARLIFRKLKSYNLRYVDIRLRRVTGTIGSDR